MACNPLRRAALYQSLRDAREAVVPVVEEAPIERALIEGAPAVFEEARVEIILSPMFKGIEQ